jgi:predicted peptidase
VTKICSGRVALHYGGGSGPEYLDNVALTSLSSLSGIILAPTGGISGTRQAEQLKNLVELAIVMWPIGPERVLVTGYSLGGDGTLKMLTTYPDMFSAAIPMATFLTPYVGQISPAVPIYFIRPELDPFPPLGVLEGQVDILKEQDVNIRLAITPGATYGDVLRSIPIMREAVNWVEFSVWA